MTKKENFERPDKRKLDELRPIKAKVGVIPNADGSAMYQSGDTIAIAAVYGPKKMHPQHQQDPARGVLRCSYNMMSFSVSDRIKPGTSRRSTEISKITEWALEPVLMLEDDIDFTPSIPLIAFSRGSVICVSIISAFAPT